MRAVHLVSSLLLVATACGDDGGHAGDTDASVDAAEDMIDAPPDSPPGATCDYTEQHDATNDDVSTSGTPEATGTTFSGAALTLCGKVDSTHFVGPLVDGDGFVFAAQSDADVRIDITGTGLESLDDLVADLYTGANLDDLVGERARFAGNHAVLEAHLAPGTGMYELVIEGGNATAIAAPVSYRVTITADQPGTRCPKITGAAAYTETRDTAGNGHRANDMFTIDNPDETLTTATTDAPEMTGQTIVPGANVRLTGQSADIAAIDSYKDIDTFEVTTGATTTELAVRLNWPGATQDLDLFLFVPGAVPHLTRSITTANHEDELRTFAVEPNTPYWITVANYEGSGAGAVSYGVSVCGAAFAP